MAIFCLNGGGMLLDSRDNDGCTLNVRVPCWYLLCSTLGFLEIIFITHKYPCDIPGTLNNQFLMDVWQFPTISHVKIWFIIQLKQPWRTGCLEFQVGLIVRDFPWRGPIRWAQKYSPEVFHQWSSWRWILAMKTNPPNDSGIPKHKLLFLGIWGMLFGVCFSKLLLRKLGWGGWTQWISK